MEGSTHVQLDARLAKQIPPNLADEHGIAIAHDGIREPVQADDVVEESAGDGGRRVRVAQQNEVGVLREPVHHREDDALAMYLGERLDEIHGDVGPNAGGHLQRLK